jgi:hypothetical protein
MMSSFVNVDSTLPLSSWNSQTSGSRLLPAVQPSMMLKARNKFQSLMLYRERQDMSAASAFEFAKQHRQCQRRLT